MAHRRDDRELDYYSYNYAVGHACSSTGDARCQATASDGAGSVQRDGAGGQFRKSSPRRCIVPTTEKAKEGMETRARPD